MSGANSVSTLCVSKQQCVFAQEDTTLAADEVSLFIALDKYCNYCVYVLPEYPEDLSPPPQASPV